ncbi:MAG: aldo/keto reductase [Chloroflexota bacterium]
MEYVQLGQAGVKVSRLALGLGLRGQSNPAEAQRMIERAINLGVNFIDCANVYGPMDDRANIGQSEEILAQVLKQHRDDLVISSKVASQIGTKPNDRGLSRYHILREVERSLDRLRTDHIDIYLIHAPDQRVPLEETMRTLDDLVCSGKVRYIGCCNFAAWRVCEALWTSDKANGTPFICVQNPYSLLGRWLELEMFPLVRNQGLGIMAYSPLAVGLLSGWYHPERPAPEGSLWARHSAWDFQQLMQGTPGEVIRVLLTVADAVGKSPAQVAMAWVLSHPEITCAIMGGDTIAHLDENVGAVGWILDPEHKQQLDDVSAPMRNNLSAPIGPIDIG